MQNEAAEIQNEVDYLVEGYEADLRFEEHQRLIVERDRPAQERHEARIAQIRAQGVERRRRIAEIRERNFTNNNNNNNNRNNNRNTNRNTNRNNNRNNYNNRNRINNRNRNRIDLRGRNFNLTINIKLFPND